VLTETRPADQNSLTGAVTTTAYYGLVTTTSDAEGKYTQRKSDAEGRLVWVEDAMGGTATYGYNAFGELNEIHDPGGSVTTAQYNGRGFKTQQLSPDAGVRNYIYNAFGEVVTQTDAKTPATTLTQNFDQLGRPTTRIEPEGTTTWVYYTATGSSKGLVHTVTSPTDASSTGYQSAFIYDSYARPSTTTVTIDGTAYATSYFYNSQGQVERTVYPTTLSGAHPTFLYSYTNGYLDTIVQDLSGFQVTLYDLVSLDALARPTHSILGYGSTAIDERNLFDLGNTRIKAIQTGPGSSTTVQNYAYQWDKVGNLTQRQDVNQTISETYVFDDLHRLTTTKRNGTTVQSATYFPNGNIETKSDAFTGGLPGEYGYTSGKPHAVASIANGCNSISFYYDANGNMTSRYGSQLTWTSYNLPKQINATGSACSGDCDTFTYGPDRQRARPRRSITSGRTLRWRRQLASPRIAATSLPMATPCTRRSRWIARRRMSRPTLSCTTIRDRSPISTAQSAVAATPLPRLSTRGVRAGIPIGRPTRVAPGMPIPIGSNGATRATNTWITCASST